MIIQCDECKAKFKLDDSKVKPEGVKVKCRKCNHVFFVFPQQQEEVQEVEKLFETNQQTGLIETPPVQQEFEKWDSDIFSGKPAFEEKEEEHQQEFEWGQFSEDSKIEKTEAQLETSIDSEIKFDLEEKKEETGEEFKVEEPEESKLSGEQTDIFETSQVDFTFEKESEKDQKIEFDFPTGEKEKEDEFVFRNSEQDFSPEPANGFIFNEIEEDLNKKKENDEFVINEGNVIDDKLGEAWDREDNTEKPVEKDKGETIGDSNLPPETEDFLTQTPRRLSMIGILLGILIVIIIGGGGTGYMWWQRVKMIESMGSIGITNVKTKYGEAKEPNQIFIVTGKIKNEFNVPKSFLKVKCTVYGKNNMKLLEKVVFAGNIFTEAELKELTYKEIEKGLNNKMGKSMVNVDVPPGKLLDFMIVFDRIPEESQFIEVEGV